MFFRPKNCFQDFIQLKPKYKDHLYDITSLVELSIESSKLKNGLVNIHIKSCTAAIMIQENGDNAAKKDILKFLHDIIPQGKWELDLNNKNGQAYLKSALIGSNKTVPFINKRLAFSENQRIFLCEFDNPGLNREIIVTISRN
jgi:secondary thiamine-phosphate synthase enzyme